MAHRRLDGPGFELRWEARDFPFSTPVQTGLGVHPVYNRYHGSFFGAKRPRRLADQPPHSSAKVNNG